MHLTVRARSVIYTSAIIPFLIQLIFRFIYSYFLWDAGTGYSRSGPDNHLYVCLVRRV